MADSFVTVSTDTTSTNGIPQRRTAEPISVSIDSGTGKIGVPAMGEPPQDRRAEIIARYAGRKAAEVVQEPPPVTQAVPDPDPPAEEQDEDEAPADEVEGDADDAAAAEADQAPEPADEDGPAQDPASVYELEQARLERDAARREVQEVQAGRRAGDFDALFEDPLSFVRERIATALGLAVDHRMVDQEMEALRNRLTWSTFGEQDLPDSTKDQLSRDGLDRKIRLDAHRRQSEKKATETPKEDRVAGEIASSVFKTGAAQFQDAARYAELLYRRPIGELLVDTLRGAVQDGRIQNWQNRSDDDLFTEASRLLNSHCRNVAQSKGLQVATLPVATVPKTPGATPRPTAAQTASSPAAPKAQNAKPRTLPQAKAGAAPSRPVTTQQTAEPLPLDSGDRMRALFAKYKSR